MHRREFLINAARTVLVLPMGTFLVQCGDDSTSGTTTYTPPTQPTPAPDTTPPAAPPRLDGANVVYTSSTTDVHSHEFSMPLTTLRSPPPAGISGDTTLSAAHNHTLVVTQADLQQALAGQIVKIVTSNTLGHTHTFTIINV